MDRLIFRVLILLLVIFVSCGQSSTNQEPQPEHQITYSDTNDDESSIGDSIGSETYIDSGANLGSTNYSLSSNENELSQEDRGGSWIYFVSFLSILVAILSTSVAFYLYRWRKILLDGKEVFMPEDWVDDVRSVKTALKKTYETFGNGFSKLAKIIGENVEKTDSLIETSISLHNKLDEKDKEIQKYKKGYEKSLFEKFIYRFVKVDLFLRELSSEDELGEKDIKMLKMLLQDALYECNVESFEPEIGVDSTEQNGIEILSDFEPTEKTELDLKIAQVIEPGYKFMDGQSKDVIKPAKVRIFKINS